jgi:hypothetical protein
MQCYVPYRVAGNWGSGGGAEYAHAKARPITGLDGGKEHVGRIRQSFEWSLSSQRDAGLNLCAMILTKDDGVILADRKELLRTKTPARSRRYGR